MQRDKKRNFGDRNRRFNGRNNKRQRRNSDHPQSSAPDHLPVDRTKTCPMLLRIFPKLDGHNIYSLYKPPTQLPPDEIQVHTWKDATLRELADLIMEVRPEAKEARLRFAVVWPDFRRGGVSHKDVGMVSSYESRRDDNITLGQLAKRGYTIGDYLDVAILKGRDGPEHRGGGGGGGGEHRGGGGGDGGGGERREGGGGGGGERRGGGGGRW